MINTIWIIQDVQHKKKNVGQEKKIYLGLIQREKKEFLRFIQGD